MNTTYQTIKDAVRHSMPLPVTYTKAKPLKRGNGRHKYTVPRRIGVSADNLFSVEMLGKDDRISKVSFMALARSDVLERNLATVTAVLAEIVPEWDGVEWLQEQAATLKDGGRETWDNVEVTMVTMDGHKVLFVTVL